MPPERTEDRRQLVRQGVTPAERAEKFERSTLILPQNWINPPVAVLKDEPIHLQKEESFFRNLKIKIISLYLHRL
jgi:hypothetical protein